MKNISRNSTHITVFKSVRLNEPHIFFSQLRPKSSMVLQDIYKQATEASYSYLDIDLSQTCPDRLRYHMGSEGVLYSSKSTNGGKGFKNSKMKYYFTP